MRRRNRKAAPQAAPERGFASSRESAPPTPSDHRVPAQRSDFGIAKSGFAQDFISMLAGTGRRANDREFEFAELDRGRQLRQPLPDDSHAAGAQLLVLQGLVHGQDRAHATIRAGEDLGPFMLRA